MTKQERIGDLELQCANVEYDICSFIARKYGWNDIKTKEQLVKTIDALDLNKAEKIEEIALDAKLDNDKEWRNRIGKLVKAIVEYVDINKARSFADYDKLDNLEIVLDYRIDELEKYL